MSARKRILYQVLLTLLLLVALEVAARIIFTAYFGRALQTNVDPGDKFLIYTSDLGWERRPNFDGPDFCGVRHTFDSRGFLSIDSVRLQDGPKRHRVMFLGDSNTYGLCLAAELTFAKFAERQLPEFDMINFGVPGYTSWQGYKQLLKYGEQLKPDSIFISFNYNDRRYVIGDDVDGDATFKKVALASTMRMLEYSYLFRFAHAVGKRLRITDSAAVSDAPRRADRLRPRVDPQNYRSNLIRMVEWARQNGAAPYFILMGDNPNEIEPLLRGIAHLERKDYEAAIKAFTIITSRSRSIFDVLARKYLSIAYSESGNAAQADEALLVRPFYSNLGGFPLMLDSDYNKIMRDVAREYSVPLIDAKSKLNERSRVFFDYCHFDLEGHEIIGKMVAEVLIDANQREPVRKTASP